MIKKYIPAVIIVEGKHDEQKLANIFYTCTMVTNGYEIPNEEVQFIRALPLETKVIVLTDNDEAGETIRKRLNAIRGNMINIKVSAPSTSKKKGIAECDNKDIEEALDPYVTGHLALGNIDYNKTALYGNENSRKVREYIFEKFNLGKPTKNALPLRLLLLEVNIDKFLEDIKDAAAKL